MYSCAGKVQCVVKLSSGGVVSVVCGVGGVVIVKVSTTQLQLRPRLRPATAPWLVLPEGGGGGGGLIFTIFRQAAAGPWLGRVRCRCLVPGMVQN